MDMQQRKPEYSPYERGPHLPHFEQISHYYGDMVRILFLGTVVVMLGGAPLYLDELGGLQIPLIIGGAVALVLCAALTSPRSVFVMRLNAVLAGVIAVVYGTWAVWGYQSGSAVTFVVREIPALLAVFAFYFSLKTLRAMLTHTLGKKAADDDFIAEERKDEGGM